jgi:hypothetical protein
MGRQFLFHALPEDLNAFLEFACSRDPVVVALRDSDRPEIEPVGNPSAERALMTLWNRDLVPVLERQFVKRTRGSDYQVPQSLPVLELSPSRPHSWKGQPALLRGRVYGSPFDTAPEAYTKWYNRLRNWIRSRFARNPHTQLGGYIGPATLAWFKQGGVLLPWPAPPVTATWESFLEAQDAARADMPSGTRKLL